MKLGINHRVLFLIFMVFESGSNDGGGSERIYIYMRNSNKNTRFTVKIISVTA